MAELTQLETKLAEVMGLAQAAKDSTAKVMDLVDDEEVRQTLERMSAEAAETAERCEQLADQLDGKKTAVSEKARETKSEAQEMMSTYLSDEVEERHFNDTREASLKLAKSEDALAPSS